MIISRQVIYWDNATFLLYIFISLLSFFISGAAIKAIKFNNRKYIIPFGLILESIILIVVKGCAGVGGDMVGGYQYNFWNSASLSTFPDKTVELGYRILSVVVFNMFHNYTVFILIVSIMTVFPVSWLAWNYHKILDINITMGLYTCIWYFQSFSLIRIYLAASIALIAFAYELENKAIKSIVWILLASLFHLTTLILLIPWIIKFGKIFSKYFYFTGMIVLAVIAFVFRANILTLFDGGRYSIYSLASGSLGMEEVLYYVPIFILIYIGHNNIKENHQSDVMYIVGNAYTFTGFEIGILKYAVTIIGRMQVLFIPITFIISFYFKMMKKNKLTYILLKGIIILYGLVRLIIYLKGYYNVDNIMPYTTFWGWHL